MVSMVHGHLRGAAGVNSDKPKRSPKEATACKMKSRQETTSLGQIATVTAKPSISDMGPPLGRASLNSNPEALYKDIWYMSL